MKKKRRTKKMKVSVLMPQPIYDLLVGRARNSLRSLSSEVVSTLQEAIK